MDCIIKLKTCKKKLHQYPPHLRSCPECNRIWKEQNRERIKHLQQQWAKNNPERKKEIDQRYRKNESLKEARLNRTREWKKNNNERVKEKAREWRTKNSEQHKKSLREWKEKNREHVRKVHREWTKKNIIRVREKSAACAAQRRAIHLKATPSWADLAAIKAIYRECSRLTNETGIKHHVDHIFPLRSKYMCGLHVESNLQIITASENMRKNNKIWPGQLDCQRG